MSFGGSGTDTSSTGQNGSTTANQATYATDATGGTTALNAAQLQGALNSAQKVFDTGGYTAGGQQVQQGQASINQGAAAAGTLDAAGNKQVAATLNGDYLGGGNPEYEAMVSRMGQAMRPSIDSSFEANGRYGSGAHAAAFDSALANEAGSLGFSNYQNERGIQASTAANLPSYTSGLTQPGQVQIGAGQARTASDYAPTQQYLGALQSISPGQTTSSSSTSNVIQNGQNTGWSNGTSNKNEDHVASK